jgi:pimeloyl-ACP methyl ester carboxylesterase
MRVKNLLIVLMATISTSAGAQVDSGYAPVNGIRMYYEIHGQGAMPLVLIHGGGSTIGTSFGNLLPLLARGRRVIAVETQGHGRTSDREGPESFQQDADDVAALARYLKIGKADFLGFSNGGSTVLQIAIRHPELVDKLVPISGAYRREGLVPGFFESMPKATIDAMPAVLREAFLKLTPDSAKLLTMFKKDKRRMIDFPDWPDDDLRSIKAPAMIISSDRDVIVPEHSVRMARLIPGARLVILPGVHGAVIGAAEAEVGKGYAEVVAMLVEEFFAGK